MSLSRFVPEPLLRSAKNRITGLFSQAPLVFFGVVIGVALLFRVGIGWVRGSSEPQPEVPVFASAATPPSASAAPGATAQPIKLNADPAAMPLPVEPPPKAKKARGRTQFPRR